MVSPIATPPSITAPAVAVLAIPPAALAILEPIVRVAVPPAAPEPGLATGPGVLGMLGFSLYGISSTPKPPEDVGVGPGN